MIFLKMEKYPWSLWWFMLLSPHDFWFTNLYAGSSVLNARTGIHPDAVRTSSSTYLQAAIHYPRKPHGCKVASPDELPKFDHPVRMFTRDAVCNGPRRSIDSVRGIYFTDATVEITW